MSIEQEIANKGLAAAVIGNWSQLQRTRPGFLATLSREDLEQIFQAAANRGKDCEEVRLAIWDQLQLEEVT